MSGQQLAMLDAPTSQSPTGIEAENITRNITTGVSGGPLAEPYDPPMDWSDVDARLGLPSDTQLRKLAKSIDASHRKQTDRTANWRTDEHRLIGLLGERAAARWLGLPMDLRIRKTGNRTVNLVKRTYPHTLIDVITRRPLANGDMPDLTRRIREGNLTNLDALVLVVYLGEQYEPWIAGWLPEIELWRSGERQRFQAGITNLVAPIGALYPMEDLWEQMYGEVR